MSVSCSLSDDDITCWFTLKAAALGSLDSLCCIPCCCFCGGCCGQYEPFTSLVTQERSEPGCDRFNQTCMTQSTMALVVPFTCCLCFWCCCGTATPCAKALMACVSKNEETQSTPPPTQTMMIQIP